MSSWDAYIQTNLVGSQQVTEAGIYDLQGNPWAYSPRFAVRAAAACSDAPAYPARSWPDARLPCTL